MDICLCASKDCSRRSSCLRATEFDKPDKGIYTCSYLGEVCNNQNGFADYIYDERTKNKC